MKMVTYLLAVIIIFSTIITAQERDSLIQLYPGLSDTVDQFDRNYFELFQNIDGFEQAVFYIRNNQKLVSKVTYSENGKTRDTTFIQQLSALDDVRKNIAEIEKENEKKYESPKEVLIKSKIGNKYECQLEMFNKKYFYFLSESNLHSDKNYNYKFKILVNNIDSMNIAGKSVTWPTIGWGALIGTGVLLGAAI